MRLACHWHIYIQSNNLPALTDFTCFALLTFCLLSCFIQHQTHIIVILISANYTSVQYGLLSQHWQPVVQQCQSRADSAMPPNLTRQKAQYESKVLDSCQDFLWLKTPPLR